MHLFNRVLLGAHIYRREGFDWSAPPPCPHQAAGGALFPLTHSQLAVARTRRCRVGCLACSSSVLACSSVCSVCCTPPPLWKTAEPARRPGLGRPLQISSVRRPSVGGFSNNRRIITTITTTTVRRTRCRCCCSIHGLWRSRNLWTSPSSSTAYTRILGDMTCSCTPATARLPRTREVRRLTVPCEETPQVNSVPCGDDSV